jgi:seryl-tRNA synthetase
MIDLKFIRTEKNLYEESCQKRGIDIDFKALQTLDEKARTLQTKLQELQEKKNAVAKKIALAKKSGDSTDQISEEGLKIREAISTFEDEKNHITQQLSDLLARLPNILAPEVPTGKSEEDNQEVRTWGKQPTFNFTPRAHYEIGETLGFMDFNTAVSMSGSRFVLLKKDLARLERALANFMLETHTLKYGYEEISPPLLVKSHALYGTGQLPKFGEDAFQTTEGHWLIPTAEVSLTNIASDKIYAHDELPLRYVAYTPCFRSESGAAGKDTRGMVRLHQFNKVELVSFVPPYKAKEEHERMLDAAESILKDLGLAYRVMLLCSGDTGFHSQKTYDLEVWLPGQNTYREISSCSVFGDYQARRLKARYRPLSEGKKTKPEFIHTLNGSGLAVGRTLVAILENYQQEDGSVKIPEVLRPYMGGQEKIGP